MVTSVLGWVSVALGLVTSVLGWVSVALGLVTSILGWVSAALGLASALASLSSRRASLAAIIWRAVSSVAGATVAGATVAGTALALGPHCLDLGSDLGCSLRLGKMELSVVAGMATLDSGWDSGLVARSTQGLRKTLRNFFPPSVVTTL